MKLTPELETKLNNYIKLLEEKYVREYPDVKILHHKFTYKLLKNFVKVIRCTHLGEEESVWCFVDYEGNLYKASGWTRPAPGIRGHIDTPILDLGGFYKRGY